MIKIVSTASSTYLVTLVKQKYFMGAWGMEMWFLISDSRNIFKILDCLLNITQHEELNANCNYRSLIIDYPYKGKFILYYPE